MFGAQRRGHRSLRVTQPVPSSHSKQDGGTGLPDHQQGSLPQQERGAEAPGHEGSARAPGRVRKANPEDDRQRDVRTGAELCI